MARKIDISILIMVGVISVFSTCKKRFGCADDTYSFETNIRAYPDHDSIRVNDTIWLEYSAPNQLKDIFINEVIDYSNAENLGTAIAFDELIGGSFSDPGSKNAADSFRINVMVGKATPNPYSSRIREFLFEAGSSGYKFKVGIIPQAKGIYCLAPSDAHRVYRSSDKCTKAFFRITFSNTNQHLYYYQQSRPGYTPSQYEMTHMYCFKVY